jgi:hypothetical protein
MAFTHRRLMSLIAVATACSEAPSLDTNGGDGSSMLTPSEPMGRRCSQTSGTNKTVRISLPLPTVVVNGQVDTNAEFLNLVSMRSGAQFVLPIATSGSFSGRLPPGRYTAKLAPGSLDGFVSLDVGEIVVEPGMGSVALAACTNRRCDLNPNEAVQERVGAQLGSLSGQLSLMDPAALKNMASNSGFLGSVSLVSTGNATREVQSANVASDLSFELKDVPFGDYVLVYQNYQYSGSSETPAQLSRQSNLLGTVVPIGRIAFPERITIERDKTMWQGLIPERPVRLTVTVNGGAMPNNTRISTSRCDSELHFRGSVKVEQQGGSIAGASLSLGATGPAVVQAKFIPGKYAVSVESYQIVGHGQLRTREQNVLPTGLVQLGDLEIPGGSATLEQSFNLTVRKVQFDLDRPNDAASIDLKGVDSSWNWANLSSETPVLLYAGCQVAVGTINMLPNSGGFGPIWDSDARKVLGEVCIPCN